MKKNPNSRYKILSLFSGCGGLDLGFAQLGAKTMDLEKVDEKHRRPKGTRFEILWSNDLYEPSCKTYSANFDAKLYTNPEEPYSGEHRIFQGDIAKIFYEKAVNNETIDVVIGGFPCQDFSLIRGADKRQGIEVKRGRLYCHFVRSLAWLQPKMFVAENVKGLVSANNSVAYEKILDDFENLNLRWSEIELEHTNHSCEKEAIRSQKVEGYEILFSKVINFANFGVPQCRERLIIIGLRKDLFEQLEDKKTIKQKIRSHLTGSRNIYSKYPLTTIETIKGRTLGNLEEDYKRIMSEYAENIELISSERQQKFLETIWPHYTMEIGKDYIWLNQRKNRNSKLTDWMNVKELVENSHKKILLELGYFGKPLDKAEGFVDESNNLNKEKDHVKARMSHIPPGENHEFVRHTEHHVTGLMSNIYRRIHPLKPSTTIIAKGGGGTWGYHFKKNRQRLTNRERARLQTYPDTFIFKGKPSEVRTQIGEAVPPLASKTIASNVVNILDKIQSFRNIL